MLSITVIPGVNVNNWLYVYTTNIKFWFCFIVEECSSSGCGGGGGGGWGEGGGAAELCGVSSSLLRHRWIKGDDYDAASTVTNEKNVETKIHTWMNKLMNNLY